MKHQPGEREEKRQEVTLVITFRRLIVTDFIRLFSQNLKNFVSEKFFLLGKINLHKTSVNMIIQHGSNMKLNNALLC